MNLAIIMWTLGKDPEVSTTPNGTNVARFSVATNEYYKDKDWNRQDKTTWHNVVAWKYQADFVEKYLHKWSKILIQGKIDNRSYEAQDWWKRYISEIVAQDIKFAWWKNEWWNPNKIQSDEDFKKEVQRDNAIASHEWITASDVPF